VPKVRKPKVVDLGPHIVLDAERCILCTRCIRVCDEVARDHQLEMKGRSDHEELGTAPGAVLDNPYSLTVDVCPVGALTSKDFRFTMRAWELFATPSICPGCATGCNVEVQHRQERVWRLVPRHNPDVNNYWMCDEGRFTYHALRQDRAAGPTIDGLPARWDTAIAKAAELINAALEGDRDSIGVVFSPHHTNEANYALAKLARDHWHLGRLYIGGNATVPERADDVLRDADVSANRAGVKAILGANAAGLAELESQLASGKLSGLIVLGHELPLSEQAMDRAENLDALVVIADREVGIARSAHVLLASAAWAEENGTVTNRQGRTQRMHQALSPNGQALPAWQIVMNLAKRCSATPALGMDYAGPNAIFDEMIGAVPTFAGAQWGKPARSIQLRFANSRG
jgi:NADH-quinone oxidoreductase subunit G